MEPTPTVCISIDVESDMPNWRVERETRLQNIKGIPRLQELFDDLGVRPTYLLTYPVADDPASVDLFGHILQSGRCEIGMHCHPWTTPPVAESEKLKAEYLSNMDLQEVRSKLRTVTHKIVESFGIHPVSYRAGRFGLAPEHLWILEDLGYQVDSSVTPLVSWTDQDGPDYRDAPCCPYHPHYQNLNKEGNSRILEIPVTISLTRLVPSWIRWLYLRIPRWTKIRGLMSRDGLNVIDMVWAYGAEFTSAEMLTAADVAQRAGAPIINFFMHSNEVWPGTSPYCKTKADLDAYHERLRCVLQELVINRGLVPRTLAEFAQDP